MRRPNIVMFLMDCVRPDHMSCYGYSVKTTPNIDNIAREATLFENAITTSGWTLPTHASLFTGLYPSKHGANWQHLFLDNKYPTMAEILQKKGYSTAGFSSVKFLSMRTGFGRGFECFVENFSEKLRHRVNKYYLKYQFNKQLSTISLFASRNSIQGKVTNWKVMDWLKKRRNTSKPLFLFIHYFDAHKPYRFNEYYNRLFLKRRDAIQKSKKLANYDWPQITLNMDDIDIDILNSLYDSKIFSIDMSVIEIINLLKRMNLYENSILIFMADHGEIITRVLEHHFYLTDEVLRIPLILRYPDVFQAGTIRKDLVSIVDILPTILEIVGVESEKNIRHLQGISLVEEFEGDRYVVAERARINDPWLDKYPDLKKACSHLPFDCIQKAIRTKTHKLIWSSNGKEELYDLSSDPKEEFNRIHDCPKVAVKLRKVLFDIVGTDLKNDYEKTKEIIAF
ncbi:MAG: sulfatase [Candidatus Hodarchaeota archaeon]